MALDLLLLTGHSGSGKSTAIRALEDEGFFCVDNLPVALVEQLIAGVAADGRSGRLALVMDARERRFLTEAPALVARLRAGPHPLRMVFLEAQEDVVVRRYSETRRLHPLDDGNGLRAAIAHERALLAPLRELADEALDTSHFSPHRLRAAVAQRLGGREAPGLRVGLMSFGFKYGVPLEADMVFDARFLANPYFDPALRPHSGHDAPVRDFVLALPQAEGFLAHLAGLLAFLLPHYAREGKRYLTVAIGCTGGRHRSVALVAALAGRMRAQGLTIHAEDRDLAREAAPR